MPEQLRCCWQQEGGVWLLVSAIWKGHEGLQRGSTLTHDHGWATWHTICIDS